jgi:uncharacterized membrane protein
MTRYELLLFLHVAAAIVWLGAGMVIQFFALRAERSRNAVEIHRVASEAEWLAMRLFVPASLAVLVFGLALVFDGPWGFDQLWIVLGLVGFATTFVTGLFLIKPVSDKIAAQAERDGGLTPGTLVEVERLLTKARSDYVVLLLVIADMVIKPTGDDVAVLIVMGLIAIAGVAYIVMRLRAIDERQEPARATA